MKLGLNLRLTQSIKLTPLLQQSIKLLHASQSELNDLIEEYLSDNIFLKVKDITLLSNQSSKSKYSSDQTYYDILNNEEINQTLREYLVENIAIFNFSEEDQLTLSYLIDSIDENGYLIDSIEGIRNSIPIEKKPAILSIKYSLRVWFITSLFKINPTAPAINKASSCLTIRIK